MITRDEALALFDVDLESGILRWKKPWSRAIGKEQAGYPMKDRHGYVYWCVTIERKIHRRARLIFLIANGRWPYPTVDHIDGNKVNDSVSNLREATLAQNSQHRYVHKKKNPWPRGVSRNVGMARFKAKIIRDGQIFHLGYFDTPEEAGAAYQVKRKELFGEFA